jgi:glucose-6-phosphate 1-dehydrogenase
MTDFGYDPDLAAKKILFSLNNLIRDETMKEEEKIGILERECNPEDFSKINNKGNFYNQMKWELGNIANIKKIIPEKKPKKYIEPKKVSEIEINKIPAINKNKIKKTNEETIIIPPYDINSI